MRLNSGQVAGLGRWLVAIVLALVGVGARAEASSFSSRVRTAPSMAAPTRNSSFIYAMDNQYTNKIHAFAHSADDDDLVLVGSYVTGGIGYILGYEAPADTLASSHSVLAHAGFLFNVNAGSNSISVFRMLEDGGLVLRSVVPTEGVYPVSLAASGDHLCVVSADGPVFLASQGSHLECFRVVKSVTDEDNEEDADEDGEIKHSSSSGYCDRRVASDMSVLYSHRQGQRLASSDHSAIIVRDCVFENGFPRTLGPIAGGDYYEGIPGGSMPHESELNGPIMGGRTVSQVSFTPEGDALAVLVKSTGVWVFPVVDGQLSDPKVFTNGQYASAAKRGIHSNFLGDMAGIPYSFLFHKGEDGERYMVITEAAGTDGKSQSTGGGISTFRFDPEAEVPLELVSDVVKPDDAPLVTPCWLAELDDFLWTGNTNEGSVQTFSIDSKTGEAHAEGKRALLPPGAGPIDPAVGSIDIFKSSERGTLAMDLAVSGDCFHTGDRFLYVVDAGFHRVVAYDIDTATGELSVFGSAESGVMPIEGLDYDVDQYNRRVSGLAVTGIVAVCV